MNHDVIHCADINQACPKECYLYQLDQDLKRRFIEFAGVPISYVHLLGSKSCGKSIEDMYYPQVDGITPTVIGKETEDEL